MKLSPDVAIVISPRSSEFEVICIFPSESVATVNRKKREKMKSIHRNTVLRKRREAFAKIFKNAEHWKLFLNIGRIMMMLVSNSAFLTNVLCAGLGVLRREPGWHFESGDVEFLAKADDTWPR